MKIVLSKHFDHLSADDRRVIKDICQDKEREEQVVLDNTEQDKLECEHKFVPVEGKRTRANQGRIRLRGLVDGFDVNQDFACEAVQTGIYGIH